MRKTAVSAFFAAGALGAASAAFAAPTVTLYGVIDTGLTYERVHGGDQSLSMSTGNYAGSRFGLKGSEDLGSGYKVSFNLEAGYASDTGAAGQSGSLFNRETYVAVTGPFGTAGAGRIGPFTSGTGSYSRYWDLEPFETGYADAGIQATQVNVWSRHSNTIYYVSPKFSGFEAGAQYAFAGDADRETTGMAADDHFGNVYVRWDGETVKTAAGVEVYSVGHNQQGTSPDKTRWSVKWAGAWNPEKGPVTLYAGVNWMKNQAKFSDVTWDDDAKLAFDGSGRGLDATAYFLGAKYQAGPAAFLASVQYLDGENKGAKAGAERDYKRWVAGLGVHYFFSKRTMAYGVASYAKGSGLLGDDGTATNRTVVQAGMTHWF